MTRNSPSPPLGRRNLLVSPEEPWPPPLFTPSRSWKDRVLASARRFLDLQAGTIWNDLAAVLPRCRGTILDVGCGAQPYRPLVDPSARYQGIDYARAKDHFGYSVPDTIYYEGDRWPLDDASVDVVLCTETLEHVAEPPAFLGEAARCVRGGGLLLLTVPFAARWHFIPHDYWRFTPSGLRLLLTAAGFERIAVHARGNAATVACYKTMALILPWLFPPPGATIRRLIGLIASPLLVPMLLALAALAWVSMAGGRGGNDCLGYTVLASRTPAIEGDATAGS